MVVQDGERKTAAGACVHKREVALEVHLPELVRGLVLEARKGPRLARARRVQLPMAAEDGGNRARAWHSREPILQQQRAELAASPVRVLRAQGEDTLLRDQGAA